MVDKIASDLTSAKSTSECDDTNPHVTRITFEHNYCKQEGNLRKPKHKRKLPDRIVKCADETVASEKSRESAPDGVFNYASAVLNDGLILLELRDAIHEGDGPRIFRCWKLMLLYWWHAGHTKYAHEAVHFIGAVKATASPRIAQELLWCRTVNTCGGAGSNIPVDLFLEFLNRTLKDYLNGIGSNVSESTIVQASKSLKCLLNVCTHFDQICTASIHHTKKSSNQDRDKIIDELCNKSKVFDYIPGRFHSTFKNISPHISSHIQVDKLTKRIQQTKTNIAKYYKLKEVLQKN